MGVKKIVISSTNISTGGLGSYLDSLATGLVSRGWIVHFLATNERGDLFDKLPESLIRHDFSGIPLSRKKVTAAADLVNSISPDILLLNNCSLLHYALPLVKAITKPVAVLHSDDERFYKTAAFFERRIFRWIAPTRGVSDKCKSYLQIKQRRSVRTIPHGIKKGTFYVDRKNRAEKIGGKICFVGFLGENKGADLLPDIFFRVLSMVKGTQLTIVGNGPLEQRLKKLCSENGTLGHSIFTGAITQESVAKVLRNAEVLLLPTRVEGFGLSIVEAMMSGVVPVVSRISGITDDIIDDGVNGLLIEPDDKEGFSSAIIYLFKNPEKLASISAAAEETAVRKYSIERMLDEYGKLFAEDDDRDKIPCRGTLGWFKEAFGEVISHGVDRKWVANRALGLFK